MYVWNTYGKYLVNCTAYDDAAELLYILRRL